MKLKDILYTIPFIFMVVFILTVSMGLNISKMKCDTESSLYLGTEVPSCSENIKVTCTEQQEKISCCLKEVMKTCCPEREDKGCDSETEQLKFNFETFISSFETNFIPKEISLFYFYIFSEQNFCAANILDFNNIESVILTKPILSEIQAFLL